MIKIEGQQYNKKSEKPNILWICTDSQRFDTLACYGNEFVNTPNIDRLAKEGVLFENVYAQNPLCTPSRGCFLTGRYPVTNGLRQNGQNISSDETLVTRILHDNGYVCGLSGKLHISACDHRIENFGENGWQNCNDQILFFKGTEPRIDDGYDEFYWDHAPGDHLTSSQYLRWLLEKNQEFSVTPRGDCQYVYNGMPSKFHQATFCVEKAMNFMKAYQDSPHPWLFSVNIFDPHFHLDPPDDFLEPYLERLDEIPLPNYVEGELENKPPYQKKYAESGRYNTDKMSDYDKRMITAAYWAMVDHIDFQVGRLLDELEKTGQKENTIVIFTSDHGEMLGDHNIYIKGPFLYDPAIKVPLIVSYPGVIEGDRRTSALVELGDLAPTVLEAAGLERHPAMQTKSFWDFVTKPGVLKDDFRDDVYCEYYNSNPNNPAQYCTMIRNKKYKLIVMHGQDISELYDLENDPEETHNRWFDPAYQEIKMDLLVKMTDRMAYTADPLPERIGIY